MNNIKLIIWDLDEVLWNGTLAENTNIIDNERYNTSKKVIPFLNEHGIINSICSKNNFDDAKKVLEDMGIFNYFIFPKISFTNKGLLVKEIIDECNFRAVNVVFVDDNIVNKKEVLYYNKGITVKDENYLFNIIENDDFLKLKKKNRLEDYKLLEKKKSDIKNKFNNDNNKFLKSLKLKINLYLISGGNFNSHKDRIFEIINRTNQLNYTKKRAESENDILYFINKYDFYIVEADDIYTNYGVVGIICLDTKNNELIHFCFSCRLMGLMIENKLYKYFNYPKINVTGNVAIPLEKNINIDWMKIENNGNSELYATKKISYKHTDTMIVRGSCEISYLFNDENRLNNLFIKRQNTEKIAKNHMSLIYLSQNPTTEDLNLVSKDSKNYYNHNFFKLNENADIYLFSIADTIKDVLKHNKTGIALSLTGKEIGKKQFFLDDNKFTKSNGCLSINEFENIIQKVIQKYEDKIIIFQNGYKNSHVYRDYNPILEKYINFKNVYLLDINKFVKNDSQLVHGHRNHFTEDININLMIELTEMVRNIYKNKLHLTPIFFSEFFDSYYLTKACRGNIQVSQMYENIYNKRLLTLNISNYICNTKQSDKIVGIFFSFPVYFIKKYKKIYPVKKYKFTLYCKIKNHIKNNIEHKVKIYTGIKWVELNTVLTTEYKKYELIETFDFNKRSTYRISFTNMYNELCISLFNPVLEDIY